jgi:hypothetical protein
MRTLSVYAIAFGIASALIAAVDILSGRRQRMAVMNFVWPLTLLWSGPLGLWLYAAIGRAPPLASKAARGGGDPPMRQPAWIPVFLATTHCGSGCALGDILAESAQAGLALSLFGRQVYASWVLDYALAFAFGILFQYFTIRPMKGLGRADGLKAALKADALSLTAWQIGMYGWMALVFFAFLGREIPPTAPEFWFLMQIGMLAGFATSFPVNAWLVRKGIKERMGSPAYASLPEGEGSPGPETIRPIGPRPAGL